MNPFKLLALIVYLFGMSALCAPVHAQLNGISEVGHSYQSDARGGCETPIGDTALAHVRQPASVALHEGGRFDSKITNTYILHNTWTNPEEKTTALVRSLLSYNLGAVHSLGKRYAMGIAWESTGWSTKFRNPVLAEQLMRASADNSVGFKKYSIFTNFAAKFFNEKLYVGAGPHLEVMSLSTDLPFGPGLLKFPKTYTVGAGYQVGTIYHPTKKTSLGAAFTSPSYMGNLTNDVTLQLPHGVDLKTKASIRSVTLPGRVAFGVAHSPTEKVKMAIESSYLNYGHSLFGDAKIGGARFGTGFKDFWVINTGIDYDFARNWSGSVGYVYNTSPVSRSQMVPFYTSTAQNQMTCGLRFKKGRIWTGFAYIVGLPSQSRSSPTAHSDLSPLYANSTVRQLLQSLNYGAGFAF